MPDIRFHGRFGQPVGKISRAVAKKIQNSGQHVQVFDGFAAVRPDAPMHSVIRFSPNMIWERSTGDTNPDVVVVLDNSLFGLVDIIKGLKTGGIVMAAGVGADILGPKADEVRFVNIDSFLKDGTALEEDLFNALQMQNIFS